MFLLEDRNTGTARIFLHAGHRHLVGAQALPHLRPVARARRPELRAPVLRLRRRRDQDRVAAGHGPEREHGRPAPRAGHAEPAPQQARDDAQPQAARGEGRLHAAGEDRRRGGGKLPARREVPAGHRLRVAGEGEPAHHPRQHFRLRPGRPVPRPARLRPDRAGHERPHVGDRAARPGPGAHRRRDRRRLGGPVGGARHHDRAARARGLRQGAMGTELAPQCRYRPARLPGRALCDEKRSSPASRQRPSHQHADLRVQDEGRPHQRRRFGRRHVEARLPGDWPRGAGERRAFPQQRAARQEPRRAQRRTERGAA